MFFFMHFHGRLIPKHLKGLSKRWASGSGPPDFSLAPTARCFRLSFGMRRSCLWPSALQALRLGLAARAPRRQGDRRPGAEQGREGSGDRGPSLKRAGLLPRLAPLEGAEEGLNGKGAM